MVRTLTNSAGLQTAFDGLITVVLAFNLQVIQAGVNVLPTADLIPVALPVVVLVIEIKIRCVEIQVVIAVDAVALYFQHPVSIFEVL